MHYIGSMQWVVGQTLKICDKLYFLMERSHIQWIQFFMFIPSGSILFPTKEHVSKSETKQSFQGEFAKRPDMIRLADAHIKLEGMYEG